MYLFLGYKTKSKAYRLFDNISKKVIVRRDAIIDKSKVGYYFLKSVLPMKDIFQYSSIEENDNDDSSRTSGQIQGGE